MYLRISGLPFRRTCQQTQSSPSSLVAGTRHLEATCRKECASSMACSRNGATARDPCSRGATTAIPVDADSYLPELILNVVLNPVRAQMVDSPAKWSWSCYQAVVGEVDAPAGLETDGLLAQFVTPRALAVAAYERFTHEGMEGESIWEHLNREVFLGDDAFVAGAHQHAGQRSDDVNIPRAQRRPPCRTAEGDCASSPGSRYRHASGMGDRRVQLYADCRALRRSFHHRRTHRPPGWLDVDYLRVTTTSASGLVSPH